MKKGVKIEKGGAMCQFGGGQTRISAMRIGLTCLIGDLRVTVVTKVVNAKIYAFFMSGWDTPKDAKNQTK